MLQQFTELAALNLCSLLSRCRLADATVESGSLILHYRRRNKAADFYLFSDFKSKRSLSIDRSGGGL